MRQVTLTLLYASFGSSKNSNLFATLSLTLKGRDYGSQLSLSVEKQISSKQGGTKGGTKLKCNSAEARRRAKRGGKNCKRRKHNGDTPRQIELPSWREETRSHGCSSLYTLWGRPLTNSNLFATLSLTLKGWDMGASCRNSLTKTNNARLEP